MSKYSEENLRAEFDRIKAERKEAGEKAKEAAEKAYHVEASQLAWDAYAHGVSKDIIHTANRDYYNASRRRALWTYYTPDEPVVDLRSRGKAVRDKIERGFEWLDAELWAGLVSFDGTEYVDGVRFFREDGAVWDFGLTVGPDGETPTFYGLGDMEDIRDEWWPEYAKMQRAIMAEFKARRAEQEEI